MSAERETCVSELWSRLASVPSTVHTARNPDKVPTEDQLPCLQFWEMNDSVVEQRMRGGLPQYKRVLTVVVEGWVHGTTDPKASGELLLYIIETKKKIYAGGANLGRTCSQIVEIETSRVLKPKVGSGIAGLGLVFEITYIETVS